MQMNPPSEIKSYENTKKMSEQNWENFAAEAWRQLSKYHKQPKVEKGSID